MEDKFSSTTIARPAYSAMTRRVVVVDDNVDASRSLASWLWMHGHDVVAVAYDGPSAIDAILEHRPAAVLLDIRLPGMNGYEVARRIRSELGESAPLLVAVTGCGTEADSRQCRAAGIDVHLVKPIDLQQLQEVLLSCDGGS
jgi:two-component system CheB/CheR fusion protein